MEFEFTEHKPLDAQILFTLTLDRKQQTERIVIGDKFSVQAALDGEGYADPFLDITCPLGTLLMDFGGNPKEWMKYAIEPIYRFLSSFAPLLSKQRLRKEAAFLKSKYDTGSPRDVYLAIRIWDAYLYSMNNPRSSGADVLTGRGFLEYMSHLAYTFMENNSVISEWYEGKSKKTVITPFMPGWESTGDMRLDLWIPTLKRSLETVSAYESLSPVLTYYMQRLDEWGLALRRCKVCGKVFAAPSRKFALCSDKCKKIQSAQNKKNHTERTRDNGYDNLRKSTTEAWRRRLDKALATEGFPPERLKEMKSAFSSYKEEANNRRKAVANGKMDPCEFIDWLYGQSKVMNSYVLYDQFSAVSGP